MQETRNNNEWVKQSFVVAKGAIDARDMFRRIFTTASWKYVDTTIGGNFCINPPPQYTEYADLKYGGFDGVGGYTQINGLPVDAVGDPYLTGGQISNSPVLTNISGSKGMGRFYAEQMDDRGVYIHMRFGVPQFTSLTQFFGGFYNSAASLSARKARTSFFHFFGETVAGIALLPFQPLILGGKAFRFWFDFPSSKFYRLKPAMHNYWSRVNMIVNGLAQHMKILPQVFHFVEDGHHKTERIVAHNEAKQYLEAWTRETAGESGITGSYAGTILDIHTKDNMGNGVGIDVRRIATRGQALAMKARALQNEAFKDGMPADPNAYLRALLGFQVTAAKETRKRKDYQSYIKAYLGMGKYAPEKNGDLTSENDDNNGPYSPAEGTPERQMDASFKAWTGKGGSSSNVSNAANFTNKVNAESSGGLSAILNKFKASVGTAADYTKVMLDEGAEFVTFKIDNPGSISDSFTNSTRPSEMEGMINSKSQSMRMKRFDFADGNIGDGMLANLAEFGVGAIRDLISGALDKVKFSGMAALYGSGLVDIPEQWDSSTTRLGTINITIPLRTPYGNKLSRMQAIWIPVSMLIAGAVAQSTGPSSYTSPFLVEMYSKGRQITRLGMITSLTITRGVGNVGWNTEGEPLGVDVSMEITDLSKILHAPVSAVPSTWDRVVTSIADTIGGGAGTALSTLAGGAYAEDTLFNDYIATLSSIGMQELVLSNVARWQLRVNTIRSQSITETSLLSLASWFSQDTLLGEIIKGVQGSAGIDR